MTIAIALLVIAFIPDYPGTTKRWWMDREYQLLAVSIKIIHHETSRQANNN
jgi:hypothetical protein